MYRPRLCETAECGKQATIICLHDNVKKRCCSEHAIPLIDKGYTAIGIDGDDFVSGFSDIPEFRERKALADRGKGNLTALEVACEREWQAASALVDTAKDKVVSTVQARFHEMKLAIWQRYEEVKRQLAELQSNFTNYLAAKDNFLSPGAALLCNDLWVQPRFIRFALADVSGEVSRKLLDGWVISKAEAMESLRCLDPSERNTVATNFLIEAAEQAKKGILEALQFADSLVSDLSLCEKEREEVQTQLLQYKKSRLTDCFPRLQQAWDLRQRYHIEDEETISVGIKLANIYGPQFEADKILRYCYDIVKVQDPLSEESMHLCVEMCGAYFASGRYLQVEQIGMWILTTFEIANHSAEHYWATLLYLTCSMREISKSEEATTILENWKRRVFQKENKLSEMYQLITSGIESYYRENQEEAVRYLGQARRIGISHFPTSPFTALSLHYLALTIGEDYAKEQFYRQAHSIYEAIAHTSVQAANTLYELGCFFTIKRHKNEITAINYFKQAQAIYEVAAPMSMNAAYNFNKLGNLFNQKGQQTEALWYYQKAQYILTENGLNSELAVSNLHDLGKLYDDLGYISEAIECYQHLRCILVVDAETCTLAIETLQSLGNLLSKDKARWKETIECYRTAQDIVKRLDPMSDRESYNYLEMGKVLEGVNLTAEAIECYEKAAAAFEVRSNLDWKGYAQNNAERLKGYGSYS